MGCNFHRTGLLGIALALFVSAVLQSADAFRPPGVGTGTPPARCTDGACKVFGSPRRRPLTTTSAAVASVGGAPSTKAQPVIMNHVRALSRGIATAVPAVTLSAMSGGALAGSLHAVTGPDHLAALLPRCIGKRWYQALRIGAIWGLGHGLSAMMMGMLAFFLKGRLSQFYKNILPKFSVYTELLIGISLILIGALGIKEAMAFDVEAEAQSLSSAKAPPKEAPSRTVFLNGLLHGFSWDGTPTLAPALAFTNWGSVMFFLVSYGAGTILSMATATSLIGEGTVRVGEALDQPAIPKQLAIGSSILAIAIGAFWTWKSLLH